jgi:hypothetical protein
MLEGLGMSMETLQVTSGPNDIYTSITNQSDLPHEKHLERWS